MQWHTIGPTCVDTFEMAPIGPEGWPLGVRWVILHQGFSVVENHFKIGSISHGIGRKRQCRKKFVCLFLGCGWVRCFT